MTNHTTKQANGTKAKKSTTDTRPKCELALAVPGRADTVEISRVAEEPIGAEIRRYLAFMSSAIHARENGGDEETLFRDLAYPLHALAGLSLEADDLEAVLVTYRNEAKAAQS